ncbi:MAG: ABC transporter permease [Vicinamibacterales bacterium]
MARRLRAMVAKELRQLLRDLPIVFILLWAFSAAIYMAGHAISMEIRNYPVVVLDFAQSVHSRELVSRLRPPYFKIVDQVTSDAAIVAALDSGAASLAVIIPPDFERALAARRAQFQVLSDGTLSMSATIAGAQIGAIAAGYGRDLLTADPSVSVITRQAMPQVDARVRVAYNPNLENAWFASLLELLNIITMVAALLTAAAMVREQEHGTLEQLRASPLRPAELFAAKIVPTVIVVLLLSSLALFGIVRGVFGTPIRGSVSLFFSVTAVYVFTLASLGLAIAVLARTLAQSMMMLLLALFPMMFLSGAFTPPESMAPWMRYASLVSPMRYYIDFGYQVLFKGNGLADVWPDIAGILIVGSVIFAAAVWRFRRLWH